MKMGWKFIICGNEPIQLRIGRLKIKETAITSYQMERNVGCESQK